MFAEMLTLAGEHDVPYSGVLCGRATWKGAVAGYAQGGKDGMTAYLAGQGVENINLLNRVVERYARPWYNLYGGRANLEITA